MTHAVDQEPRKTFILDTNILLHDPFAFLSFEEHTVAIPMTVLEELDDIKDRKRDVSRDARVAIRALERTLENATPEQLLSGVTLKRPDSGNELGKIRVINDFSLSEQSGHPLPGEANDNRIINTALYLQQVEAPDVTVLVTKDINMRLKAKGAGVIYVEDYRNDQLLDDIQLLTKGYDQLKGDFWSHVKDCESEASGRDAIHRVAAETFPNAFVNEYIFDETEQFVGRVLETTPKTTTLLDIGYERIMSRTAWGIKPKNITQALALHALLDTSIDMAILTGPAGCGKTLLAVAAALELVIEQGLYDKIIVTRSTPEIAESIGFLPGTEEEKMAPWLAAIADTLEVLHKDDESPRGSVQYIMDKANIQLKSVNFMRGRSIQNAIVILDESQNLTAEQLKTIITRCGEGTKLVCIGNLAQIDCNYLTALTSGLTYIVERFKNFEGSASITLQGVMRSRLASFAEQNL